METLKAIDHGDLQFLIDHPPEGFPDDDPELEPEHKPPDPSTGDSNSGLYGSPLPLEINGLEINERDPDYEALRRFLLDVPVEKAENCLLYTSDAADD